MRIPNIEIRNKIVNKEMKIMKKYLAILTVVCLAAQMSLGDVFQDLAKYKYGDESNTADEADKLLQNTPVDQHGAIEDTLIAVVSAKDATQDGKEFACRMLQQIGTEKCIPAVTGLLTDEVLSHNARLVLERMTSSRADEAMRSALDKAPDKAKIGIMGSLGEHHDAKAVKQVAKLADSADQAVAFAAIKALGRIGGDEAATILLKMKVADSLKAAWLEAMVTCGKSVKGSAAVSLYEAVLASDKPSYRTAAIHGMLSADEKKAVQLIVDIVKGDDQVMRRGVLHFVAFEKGDKLTKSMTAMMDGLTDEKKQELITVLGVRGDSGALACITECVSSTNTAVRDASIMSISKIGGSEAVKSLLAVAGNGGIEAIVKMPGDDVNKVLTDALADKKLKIPAIKALAARNCYAAVPAILKLVQADDADIRKTAWSALGSLASEDQIVTLAEAAFVIKDQQEMSCAVAAVKSVCAYAKDKGKCFDVVAGYFDKANDAGKSAIMDLASVAGTAPALEMERKAMKSGSKELYGKAVRALAAWSNDSACPDLLELARNAQEEVDRILALRGYIRIAGATEINLKAEKRMEMFKTADELAKRADEKKMIISGLKIVEKAEALNMLNKYLDNADVRNEAEQSGAELAFKLRKSSPAEAKALAEKLLTSKDNGIVDKAKKIIDKSK